MLNNNLDVNSLEEINKNPVRITLNGKRHYTTPLPSGPAPSVTTIISQTASEQNKKKLEMWSKNNPGSKRTRQQKEERQYIMEWNNI
jgi:hypothetical protein